jgi:levanase
MSTPAPNSTTCTPCAIVCAFAVAMVAMVAMTALPASGPPQDYKEALRQQFHFTTAQNFMQDHNGPVYHKGEYHLL